jgi:arginyl-tRNA synthetase
VDVRKITESLLLAGIKRKFTEWGADRESSVSLEIPRQEEHGDFSTNVAMQLARHLGKKPREVAGELTEAIRREDDRGWIASLSVAGPGFINIVLSDDAWREVVATALRKGIRFGSSDQGVGQKVLIEFVSANPTGPLHIGHGRGAAVGDALARILSFEGYEVATEYYVNDVGNQMDNLGRSLYARYLQACGVEAHLPEDGYQGNYLVEMARKFREEEGDGYKDAPPSEALPVFRTIACDRILEGIRKDLEDFRVRFDRWFRERGFTGTARSRRPSRSWEAGDPLRIRGGGLFKSEAHGDEKDRFSSGRTAARPISPRTWPTTGTSSGRGTPA